MKAMEFSPSVEGLVDAHAHYFDRRFESETESGADGILQNEVFGQGIAGVINVGTNPENALRCIRQARSYPRMMAAVGVHPEDAMYLDEDVETLVAAIRDLLDTEEKRRRDKIVALGEIGLDYHYENCDKERQMRLFRLQLELARELELPVIIHDRDAHGDCFETVLDYPEVRGVFHSFSGSAEMAKKLTRRGWYISFSGVLTFKNARRVREVAQIVPEDRMLVETDCPYLAPEPFRGRLNHSGRMGYTALTLAETRGISYERVVAATRENTEQLFGIKFV